MGKIDTKPPRREPGFTDTRDFERWMYNLFKKLGTSDVVFDDIDARSMNPVLGMLQDAHRKIESISRDMRHIRSEIESLKRVQPTGRMLPAKIAELERRIDQIEGEL